MKTAADAADLDYHRLSTIRAEMERVMRNLDLAILAGDSEGARGVASELGRLAAATEGAAGDTT